MKVTKLLLSALIASVIGISSYAQEVLSVDPLTGALQGSIPLASVRSKTLSYPLTVSYHTNGQKPYEGTGNMGIGWNMDDSPSIVREIRDLPDELNNANQKGWLNGGYSKVHDVVNSNPDDISFGAKLNSLGGFSGAIIYDTEPDIFHVSVTGHLSFSFMLDGNGETIVLPNYTHYRISYGTATNVDICTLEIFAPGKLHSSFVFVVNTSTYIQ